MQQQKRVGGWTYGTDAAGRVTREPAAPLRERGHFGVDGPVSRRVMRAVEEQQVRSNEASWLSAGLSRGFAGTRIA